MARGRGTRFITPRSINLKLLKTTNFDFLQLSISRKDCNHIRLFPITNQRPIKTAIYPKIGKVFEELLAMCIIATILFKVIVVDIKFLILFPCFISFFFVFKPLSNVYIVSNANNLSIFCVVCFLPINFVLPVHL